MLTPRRSPAGRPPPRRRRRAVRRLDVALASPRSAPARARGRALGDERAPERADASCRAAPSRSRARAHPLAQRREEAEPRPAWSSPAREIAPCGRARAGGASRIASSTAAGRARQRDDDACRARRRRRPATAWPRRRSPRYDSMRNSSPKPSSRFSRSADDRLVGRVAGRDARCRR